MGALSPYRVVELACERTRFAGFLLATLGADVVAVRNEPASAAIRSGECGDPGAGLSDLAYGRGKRGVRLDPASASFRRLVEGADLLIEACAPELDAAGLGPERLAELNQALVHVSLSPFGPDADTAASDLAILAASGALLLGGDPDRAPCRLSVPQAWLHTAALAAGAGLAALYERNRSGRGQRVELSAHQVCTVAAGGWVLPASANAPEGLRSGGEPSTGIGTRYIWPAADGHVSITHLFGPAFGPATARLMAAVHDAGFCDAQMRDTDWIGYGARLHTAEVSAGEFAVVRAAIAAYTSSRTKADLFAEARTRRLFLAPVNTVADVHHSDQLADRGYWTYVPGPDGAPLRCPGAWARLGATPLTDLTGAAPPLIDPAPPRTEVADREPYRGRPDPEPPALPLSGVGVLDFTRSFAGPTVGRLLADLGANVVRIESTLALDPARTVMPYQDNEPGVERSVLYSSLNAGKFGITLDMTRDESRAVVHDLVGWSDVVMESFAPGLMAKWGYGYAALADVNPSLVMLSTSLMGAGGPLAGMAGYGNLASAICGFTDLLGWPDRAPAGPFAAYTDYVSPYFMVLALIAALDHRRRTGEGQLIDLSQAECSLHLLTPLLLDYAATGRVAQRAGNADPGMSPHGVYRARGDDRWVSLVCTDDAQWRALCVAMERPDLAAAPELAREAGRVAAREAVDAAVEAWTCQLPAEVVVDRLLGTGISVHLVNDSADCLKDPKLAAHFVEVDHPVLGAHRIEGTRFRMSRSRVGPVRGGPTLNEHLFEVLHGFLGYDDGRIAELIATGIFE